MDARPAHPRGRQDGPAAEGMPPLTERLLRRLPGPRMAWVLAGAAIPFLAAPVPGSFMATVGDRPIAVRFLIGLVYAYVGEQNDRLVGASRTCSRNSGASWTR